MNRPISALRRGNMMAENIDVLYIGNDLGFARQILSALASLKAEQPDKEFRVFPGVNPEKITEFLGKYTLHSIIVDELYLTDKTPEHFLKSLQEELGKSVSNKEVPVVFISDRIEPKRIKAVVRSGYVDYIVKPLDQSLFLQKMNMYNPKKPILEEDALFTKDSSHDIDVGFTYKTKSISEFGMKVESTSAPEKGAIVTLYVDFIQANIPAIVSSISKVTDTSFMVDFMFIGITPADTQAIRKFIRQEYAEEKQAG